MVPLTLSIYSEDLGSLEKTTPYAHVNYNSSFPSREGSTPVQLLMFISGLVSLLRYYICGWINCITSILTRNLFELKWKKLWEKSCLIYGRRRGVMDLSYCSRDRQRKYLIYIAIQLFWKIMKNIMTKVLLEQSFQTQKKMLLST